MRLSIKRESPTRLKNWKISQEHWEILPTKLPRTHTIDGWSVDRTSFFIRFLFLGCPPHSWRFSNCTKDSKFGVHPTGWPHNAKTRMVVSWVLGYTSPKKWKVLPYTRQALLKNWRPRRSSEVKAHVGMYSPYALVKFGRLFTTSNLCFKI